MTEYKNSLNQKKTFENPKEKQNTSNKIVDDGSPEPRLFSWLLELSSELFKLISISLLGRLIFIPDLGLCLSTMGISFSLFLDLSLSGFFCFGFSLRSSSSLMDSPEVSIWGLGRNRLLCIESSSSCNKFTCPLPSNSLGARSIPSSSIWLVSRHFHSSPVQTYSLETRDTLKLKIDTATFRSTFIRYITIYAIYSKDDY